LRELEARFPDTFVAIGVHTAKFPTERDDDHLSLAVQRLEIEHPVINDAAFAIWQGYAVRAWPTLMFVDPEGKVIGKHEGEFTLDQMEPVIANMLAEFEAAGLLSREPLPAPQPLPAPSTPLAFPGKVHADAPNDRLYIADSNHNRIVATTLAGKLVAVYGSGAAGFTDGPPETATFNRPQGLTLDAPTDALYVADTENHSIRKIDLASGATTTIAGTGQQARSYLSGGAPLETPLTSPWDVCVVEGVLYIAMAGNHQLWMHRLGTDEVGRFAGSGHEGLRDAATAGAWLAQPSALTSFGKRPALLFADSETSSVRVADLPGYGSGQVTTLIGEDLFEFGDVDGPPDVARLQHPLGVAYDADTGVVYIADTYNSKIKRIDPEAGNLETWLDEDAGLNEPAGLNISDGALWIADTNHHRILRAEIVTGRVTMVDVRGG
jgi:DNA-binding beta-propeller fold protein YncE